MFTYPKILRIRYSLRTLVIATALAGLVFSWVAYQLNWIRQRQEIIASPRYRCSTGPFFLWDRPAAPWQIRIFGEEGYLQIIVPQIGNSEDRFGSELAIQIDDPRLYPEERQEMLRVSELFPEAHIYCDPPL